MGKTLTAPLAIIKVTDITGTLQVIGKMRNIRITENVRRGRVTGLGELTPSELPALEWSGTLNVGQYAIDFSSTVEAMAIDRKFNSTVDFVKSLLFNDGIQIDVLQKTKTGIDPTVVSDVGQSTYVSIKGVHFTSGGFDLAEGQIGGKDATFEYMNPVLYT